MLGDIEIRDVNGINAPSPTLAAIHRRLQSFNEYVKYWCSRPLDVVLDVLDYTNYFMGLNPGCCACCLCATITSVVGVTSIAIGVGIGVGVGCTKN